MRELDKPPVFVYILGNGLDFWFSAQGYRDPDTGEIGVVIPKHALRDIIEGAPDDYEEGPEDHDNGGHDGDKDSSDA